MVSLVLPLALLFFGHLAQAKSFCFEVDGMVCGKCVEKIQQHFSGRLGITTTEVSLREGSVRFEAAEKSWNEEKVLKEFSKLKLPSRRVTCSSSLP